MSHVEPEHNRQPEGEEPEEPFPPITKEWLESRAQLEEGCEIGAGAPELNESIRKWDEFNEEAHRIKAEDTPA